VASTAQQAYDDIVAHIKSQGGPYSQWYCGIASDIQFTLFERHNVPKKDHWRIHRDCVSDQAARVVEKALLEIGCDGGAGGGDENSVYVYAYLKTSVTDP
jgi:hypothetical protein